MENKKYYDFPINYNRKEKLLGIIEYKTIILIGAWGVPCTYLIKLLAQSSITQIYLFAALVIFPSIIMIVGVFGESTWDFIKYFFKYAAKSKCYVYRK